MKRSVVLSAVLVSLALCGTLADRSARAQSFASNQPPLSAPGASSEIWGDARAELVDRLFRGVLGRAAHSIEAQRAAEKVADGELGELIDTLISSSEYRDRRASTSQLLERFFRGLLDRSPTDREAYSLSRELQLGRDRDVVRRLVDSDEFRAVLEGSSPASGSATDEQTFDSESERACASALAERVSQDLGRPVGVRLLSAEATDSTVLNDVVEGEAELDDASGQKLSFVCRVSRFGSEVDDIAYEMAALPESRTQELLVTCESPDRRYLQCPADTRGGVRIERQISRTPCIRGLTWDFDEEGIWVHRGCRAVFRVAAPPTPAGLETTLAGWGFVRQQDGRAEWLREARIDLAGDGAAVLEFSGDGSARFTGRWYESGPDRAELTLSAIGGSSADGAGTVDLANGQVERIELAGSAGSTPFNLVFTSEGSAEPVRLEADGSGMVEIDDGRRVALDRAMIDLERDGNATLRFAGEQQETFSGRWFAGWAGTIELAIDAASDEEVSGGGTLHRGADGHFKVEIAGVTADGKAFRIEFLGEG